MSVALAFDIYGTLIDPHGVVDELSKHVGDRAQDFSNIWRDKQLEYTWRRALMQRYENFPVCTRQALDYTDTLLQTNLGESAKVALMQVYRVLPAYDDVPASLQSLADSGFRMFGFSNGVAEAVSGLLEHAGIDRYFEGVVSVDALQTFKPSPDVYHHFIEVADTAPENCWLVSSNGFDVIGAVSAGMKAAWLKRSQSVVFDPWGVEPTLVLHGLDELNQKIII
ncbi:MAG: haloacid dehalogenase type II [Gammaproteobacteria bacterium]|nr:haloacid dehalogenase type II [Gammaproteobacteria bacterium]